MKKNKNLIRVGFGIYLLIASFIYVDILRVYMEFVDQNIFHAIGLALGLDALVVFLNIVSVLKRKPIFSFFAYTTTFFVWFIVFSSLSGLYRTYQLEIDIRNTLAFVLSLVPLFSAFIGKTLGYLISENEKLIENEKANQISDDIADIIEGSSKTVLMDTNIFNTLKEDKRRKYIYENYTKEDIQGYKQVGDKVLIAFKQK